MAVTSLLWNGDMNNEKDGYSKTREIWIVDVSSNESKKLLVNGISTPIERYVVSKGWIDCLDDRHPS